MQHKPPGASSAHYHLFKNIQTVFKRIPWIPGMAIKRSIHPDFLAVDRVGDPTTEQLKKSKQH